MQLGPVVLGVIQAALIMLRASIAEPGNALKVARACLLLKSNQDKKMPP